MSVLASPRTGAGEILTRCYDSNPEDFAADAGFCRLVSRDPADNSLTVSDSYVNLATDNVKGLDYTVRYRKDVGPGTALLNLAITQYTEISNKLFAEDPLLHRNDPARARRLAWLIAERSPDVNAALFAAPAAACNPDLVEPRFCTLPEQVMRQLQAKGRRLDAVSADRAVWNRLAA